MTKKNSRRVGAGHASIVYVHSIIFFYFISKFKKEIQVKVEFQKRKIMKEIPHFQD